MLKKQMTKGRTPRVHGIRGVVDYLSVKHAVVQ
jgi:hypothetical protein